MFFDIYQISQILHIYLTNTGSLTVCKVNYLALISFVMFGGRVFQQTVGIPMDNYRASPLTDMVLYTYEVVFVVFHKKNENKIS